MDPFWILPALFLLLWGLLVRMAKRARARRRHPSGTDTSVGLARRGKESHDHSGYDA